MIWQRGGAGLLKHIHGMLELILGKGETLYAAFIDYENCFDYLDWAAIIAKLIKNQLSKNVSGFFETCILI